MLSLSEAKRLGRLKEFVEQEERRHVPPVNSSDFDAAVRTVARQPKSQDRTSGSPVRGGSNGKKTR